MMISFAPIVDSRLTNGANADGEQNRALYLLLAQLCVYSRAHSTLPGLAIKLVRAERRQLLGIKVCLRTRRLHPYFRVGSSNEAAVQVGGKALKVVLGLDLRRNVWRAGQGRCA